MKIARNQCYSDAIFKNSLRPRLRRTGYSNFAHSSFESWRVFNILRAKPGIKMVTIRIRNLASLERQKTKKKAR